MYICSCYKLAFLFDKFSFLITGTRNLGGSNVMATIKTRWLLSIMLANLPNCSFIGGKLMKGLCTYLAFVKHCKNEIRLSLHYFLCFTCASFASCACVLYYIMQLHVLLASSLTCFDKGLLS